MPLATRGHRKRPLPDLLGINFGQLVLPVHLTKYVGTELLCVSRPPPSAIVRHDDWFGVDYVSVLRVTER